METIGTTRIVWLGLGAAVLALFAASGLTSGAHGPVCTVQGEQQPGFSALASAANPACIRIVLR